MYFDILLSRTMPFHFAGVPFATERLNHVDQLNNAYFQSDPSVLYDSVGTSFFQEVFGETESRRQLIYVRAQRSDCFPIV